MRLREFQKPSEKLPRHGAEVNINKTKLNDGAKLVNLFNIWKLSFYLGFTKQIICFGIVLPMSFEWKIYDFLSFGWFWVLAQNFREKFWFWAKLKKPKKTTGLIINL